MRMYQGPLPAPGGLPLGSRRTSRVSGGGGGGHPAAITRHHHRPPPTHTNTSFSRNNSTATSPPPLSPDFQPTHHHHHHHHHHPNHYHHHRNGHGHHHHSYSQAKPSDISSLKNQKALDGGNIKGDLPLSEESEDEQSESHESEQLQSSVVGSSNSKPLLSPLSGGNKTSEDSSSEEESSDDSEVSSNNSTEDDEQPASEPSSSPKAPGGDTNPWKLEKFIPPRKVKSPSQETVTPGPTPRHAEDDSPMEDIKAPVQSQRKRDRRNSKVAATVSSHRGSRHAHEPVLHSDDSSDEGEPHPRPTLRPVALLRTQKSRQTKAKPSRRVNNILHDSDSDSDSFSRPSKSDSILPAVTSSSSCKDSTKLPDKSRKSADLAVSRESTRRTPKKRNESKKDNQSGAKPDAKSRRRVKSQEYIQGEMDTDSDAIVDIESTTPVKLVTAQRNTPSRTPKESNTVSSPVKARQPSPQVSPLPTHCVSGKNINKGSKRTPLSESQSSEPLVVNSKSDDLFGRSQGNSEKMEVVRDKSPVVINPAFPLDKDKKGRERDPVERVSRKNNKTHRDTKKSAVSNSSESKDRSKKERSKGVSESTPLDNRLSERAAAAASPLVDKLSESPIVSPEPKVPISQQLHHDYGSLKLTCTIPLSLIDKVPKPSVNSVSNISKVEIKEELDKKEVLDNRTTGKGGKGKRKTGDPNTKELCNEDKKTFIISSIFRVARRPDSESDADKVKKEPKTQPVDSDDSDKEKSGSNSSDKLKEEGEDTIMGRPTSLRQLNVSASSPLPSASTPEASSSSRQHRKKKKDSLPEKSPPSNDRKKPRCNSERLVPDHSMDSCDMQSKLRTTGHESDHGPSRKRERERDSSLESSSSSGRRSKKSRTSKSKDSSMKSPSARPGNQHTDNNSSHAWSQEKDVPQVSQRPQPSQQSSQKGYNGMSEGAESSHEAEYVNEERDLSAEHTTPSNSGHQGYYGKVKDENADYHTSRPPSEHESGASSYRSTADQSKTSDGSTGETLTPGAQLENGTRIVPPQQSGSSTTTSLSQTFLDPDYMGFMNMAKDLKHAADAETDRSMQAMKYLEAALYFILSGKAMENDAETETSASIRIYKDTLSFIKYVSSVFMREKQEGSLNSKLAIISLRCQSLLSLKIYKMIRHEHKENQRQLNNYFHNYNKNGSGENNNWNGHRTSGSPSHLSQTPSPAGSIGSEGSQSSGYTTSTEGARSKNSGPPPVGQTPPHPQPPPICGTVPVPQNIHALLVKQNQLSGHLATAHDQWIEADKHVFSNGLKEFFIELDRYCSQLTLHSSLSELVYYVQFALARLKD